jgi:Outer membrane lipoprotein-sorting protein
VLAHGHHLNLNNFLQLTPASVRLVAALILSFVAAAKAQTNALSDFEIQGRQLAQQLCEARPVENFTNSGILNVRSKTGEGKYPIRCLTLVTATNWSGIFELYSPTNSATAYRTLTVIHSTSATNQYRLHFDFGGDRHWTKDGQQVIKLMPFIGDFGCADLGLEFFHWPAQKVLPKPTNLVRGREYRLLESTNPDPATNGYSRVLSSIDKETGGILEAEVYDAKGDLLKVFEPKSFKKVNGQWELQEMEIRNVQTGSRTRLDFDVKK